MLTKESIKILRRMIQNAIKLKCVPYRFNESTFQLDHGSTSALIIYYFVNVNVLIQTVILINQFFVHRKNQSVTAACAHLFRVICNTSGAIFQLSIIWNPDELKRFLNAFVQYAQEFEAVTVGRIGRTKTSGVQLDKLMKIIYYFSFVYCSLVPLQIFWHPTSPRYLCSIFYARNPSPKLIPIFVILDFIYALFSWHVILFNIFIFLAYVHSTTTILDWILNHLGDSEEPNARDIKVVYRSLQILSNEFTASISPLSLPTTLLTSLAIPITLNFMAIRLHEAFSAPQYAVIVAFSIIGMIFTVTSWPAAASVNSLSAKIVRKSSFSTREKRFMWTLKIRVNCFCNLTRFLSVKIFAFVIYWTMKTLLLF